MSLKRIRKRCCIGGCTTTDLDLVSLHRVPEDTRSPGIKEMWCSVIRESQDNPAWVPLKNSVVCGKHFRRRDFHGKRDQGFIKTSLRKEAVPSLNLGPNLVSPDVDVDEESDYEDSGPASKRERRAGGEVMSEELEEDLVRLQRQLAQVTESEEDWMDMEEDPVPSPSTSFPCISCSKTFPTLNHLQLHQIIHKASSSSLPPKARKKFDFGFRGKRSGRQWPRRFLGPPTNGPKAPPPLIPLSAVSSLLPLGKWAEKSGESEEDRGGDRGAEKRYQCRFCVKTFSRTDHLKQHMTSHTGSRPYACHICPKRFPIVVTLKRHLKTHSGDKPYKCNLCPRRFNQTGHLKRHMESPFTHALHVGTNQAWPCRLCTLNFQDHEERLAHEHEEHGTQDETVWFDCKFCGDTLEGLKNLLAHFRKKHYQKSVQEVMEEPKDGEEPLLQAVVCRLCWEGFASTEERLSHEIIAHNIKDTRRSHQCKFCQKLFTSFPILTKHVAEHEAGSEEEEEFERPARAPQPMISEPILWTCRLCPLSFTEQLERLMHEKSIHLTKNPDQVHVCKHCGKEIATFRGLTKHLRNIHGERTIPEDLRPRLPTTKKKPIPQPVMSHVFPLSPEDGDEEGAEGEEAELYVCRLCDEVFGGIRERLVHESTSHGTKSGVVLNCKFCGKGTSKFKHYLEHLRRRHGEQTFVSAVSPEHSMQTSRHFLDF